MKKLFALLLIAALALSLAACGESNTAAQSPVSNPAADVAYDKAAIRANFEKAETYADAAFSGKNMTSSIQDDDDNTDIYKYWSYDGEPDKASISSEIEIDGNKIVIGTTTAKEVEGFDLTVQKNNATAQPGETVSLSLSKDTRSCSAMLAPNNTDKAVNADDLPVFEVVTSAKDFSLPFTYCGLSADSTMEEVLEALGTPNNMVTLSSEDMGVSIELNYNNITEDGDKQISDSVILRLVYDLDSNTARVDNIDLRHEVNTAVTES